MGLTYLDSSVVLDAIEPAASRHESIDVAILLLPPEEFTISDLVRLESSIHALRTNDVSGLADLSAFFAGVIVLPMVALAFDLAAPTTRRSERPTRCTSPRRSTTVARSSGPTTCD